MKRLAIFAHFDEKDEVKDYIAFHLKELRSTCSRVVFVSTSRLGDAELAKLLPLVDEVHLKDNVGLDFGMWQLALGKTDLHAFDELLLTNSSIFGPIHPLGPILDRMTADPCDFWGMTDNFEHRWHLQSYFLVFKPRVLRADTLRTFFESVLPYRDKTQIIVAYELGLTKFLVDGGYQPRAFAPVASWASEATQKQMNRRKRWNATLFYPTELLSLGMPFVKVNLLRENVGKVPLDPVLQAMKDAGYPPSLVDFSLGSRSRESFVHRIL